MSDKEIKIDTVSVNDLDSAPTAGKAACTDSENIPGDNGGEPIDMAEQIEKLSARVTELTDKYLRVAAELENTRRRAALDIESAARNRAMVIAKKFLPVMDAIESAQKHSPDDEGIKSLAMAMDGAFAQIGIVKIESVGQVMNPQFHNAIQVIDAPSADGKSVPHNTIVEEMQSGYMFGDSVLRPAMVVVSK